MLQGTDILEHLFDTSVERMHQSSPGEEDDGWIDVASQFDVVDDVPVAHLGHRHDEIEIRARYIDCFHDRFMLSVGWARCENGQRGEKLTSFETGSIPRADKHTDRHGKDVDSGAERL